jgi:MFS transporter, DHA1 family, multidrug resistance protein
MAWPPRKPHPETLAIGALLTALIALGQIATSLYIPSMPSMVDAFATTKEQVTLTFTVFLAGFAVSQLVFGPLSDRFGRRPVLVAGMLLFIAASIGCATSGSILALAFWRFVQSMGACAGAVIGRAIVRDVYGPKRAAKAFAFIGIAFSLSPAVSPIIGGYLQVWFGWQSNFVFLTLVASILLVLAWFLLGETNRDPDRSALNPREMLKNYGLLLRTPVFLGYMLAMALVFSGLMSFVALAPFLVIDSLGYSPHHFGMLAAISALGTLGGNLTAGFLTTRLGPRRMVLTGILTSLAGAGLMLGTGLAGFFTVYLITGSLIVFLWGMGIVMPNAMGGALAPFPRMAGAASALLGFFQMAVAATAAQLAGLLPHGAQWPLGLMMTGLATSALILFGLLAWKCPEPGQMPQTDRHPDRQGR